MSSKLSQLNFLLVIFFLPHVIAIVCDSGLFGLRCEHVCHCEDESTCDRITGECGTGCAKGWDGHACMRENIALNRLTYQSSTSYGGTADKAVDGDTCSYYDEHKKEYSCSHTTDLPYKIPHWMVFLDQPTNVYDMQIFNRDDLSKKYSFRLQKFHVIVANSSTFDNGDLCYTHNNTKFVSHIFHCNKPLIGSVIVVQLHHVESLSICEFKVFQCADYWFGKDCSQPCMCRNNSEVCNPVTGSCNSGKLDQRSPIVTRTNQAPTEAVVITTSHIPLIILGVILALALLTIIILTAILIQKTNFVNRFSIRRLQL